MNVRQNVDRAGDDVTSQHANSQHQQAQVSGTKDKTETIEDVLDSSESYLPSLPFVGIINAKPWCGPFFPCTMQNKKNSL